MAARLTAAGRAGVDARGKAGEKLRIRGVRKSYGPVIALDETDLDLAEGEFLTLLGPSGSGKTTLLMTVAGLTEPDKGEIWIDGTLATYAPVFRRDIGMVFQSYALFPHLTVHENIAFPLRMRRIPEADIRKAVTAALETVQLPGLAARYPRELSGGQQQRVALARCFVYRPSIILMDEPLGALDKKLRDEMQLEIKRLHSAIGITVLYVTHDQEEAMAMSDRICLMNRGGVEQIGTADDLYFKPQSLFAAEFLGDSNILPAVVTATGPRLGLVGPGGRPLAAPGEAPEGAPVSVMVRPENLRLLDGAEPAENRLDGTVEDVLMVGGVTRTLIRLSSGETVSSKRLTGQGRRAAKGERVTAGFDGEDAVVLTRATTRPSP